MWGADGVTPVPIRWVLVIDPTGKLDPLPLMSTDTSLLPEQIIALYIDRWSIEVMFSTLYKIPCETETGPETVTEPKAATSLLA